MCPGGSTEIALGIARGKRGHKLRGKRGKEVDTVGVSQAAKCCRFHSTW
jgi:hypothetical protein